MKSRDIVGKKIKKVVQQRRYTRYDKAYYDITGFILENGTVISFSVVEHEDDYGIEATVRKAG